MNGLIRARLNDLMAFSALTGAAVAHSLGLDPELAMDVGKRQAKENCVKFLVATCLSQYGRYLAAGAAGAAAVGAGLEAQKHIAKSFKKDGKGSSSSQDSGKTPPPKSATTPLLSAEQREAAGRLDRLLSGSPSAMTAAAPPSTREGILWTPEDRNEGVIVWTPEDRPAPFLETLTHPDFPTFSEGYTPLPDRKKGDGILWTPAHERDIREGIWASSSSSSSSLTTAEKGAKAEAQAGAPLVYKGYKPLDCRLPGNRGIDHIFVKYGKSGDVKDVLVVESKFATHGGKPKLSESNGPDGGPKVQQLSDGWMEKQMGLLESHHPETHALLKQHEDKIRFKANVLDKNGTHHWYDYGRYTKSGSRKAVLTKR